MNVLKKAERMVNPRGFDAQPFIQLGGALAGAWFGYELLFNGLIKKDCKSIGGKLTQSIAQMAKIDYVCGSGSSSPGPSAQATGGGGPAQSPASKSHAANGACGSTGLVYLNQNDAQNVYSQFHGPAQFDAQNFVGQCADGYVAIVGGKWL